jgi:hypothetical protein
MADRALPVVWRLVGAAIERIAKAVPTIVGMADEDGEPLLLDLGWPRVEAQDTAGIAEIVQGKLAGGPVLLGPQWRRISPGDPAGIRLPGYTLISEALLAQLRPAGKDSVLGAVIPASTLAAPGRRPLREAVDAHWRPAVVLYAVDALRGIRSGFETAVLLLVPRERQWSTIIYQVPHEADPDLVEDDFRGLVQRQKSAQRGQHGYVVKTPLPPGESLHFDRHDPAVLDRRADLSGYGITTSLGELCETVALGIRLPGSAEPCQPGDEGAVRLLSGRDIRLTDSILPPDEHSNWARVPAEFQLRQGDIVLPRIFNPSRHKGLVAVEVTPADLPAAASDMVIWLRPRAGLGPEHLQFTLLYLQSALARTLASSSSGSLRGMSQLSPSGLASLDVPVPDAALMTAIKHIRDAEKRFEHWHDEAGVLLQSMFLNHGAEAQRAHIIESGLKVRTRAEAAVLVDDPGYFARTRFPYPLALRWRRVEAAQASRDWNLAYKEIREASEIFTCYLALTALALARSGANPVSLGAANQIRDQFSRGAGPGWGHWKAVLHGVGEIRKLPAGHPLRRIRELATDEEATAALQRLYNRRNDESHLRTVDDDDLPPEVAEAGADLAMLARRAAFVADWTIADVVSCHWDSFRKTATVTYRPMMGDHPIVSARSGQYPTSDLEQGSLYIIDDDERWHLLRPYLVGKRCTICKTWSTFHADMISDGKDGKLYIKSLEHGHIEPAEWIAESLNYVGLLT